MADRQVYRQILNYDIARETPAKIYLSTVSGFTVLLRESQSDLRFMGNDDVKHEVLVSVVSNDDIKYDLYILATGFIRFSVTPRLVKNSVCM